MAKWMMLARAPSIESGLEDGDFVGFYDPAKGDPEQFPGLLGFYVVEVTDESAAEVEEQLLEAQPAVEK